MNEYKESFDTFNNQFTNGVEVQGHSGSNGENSITVYSAKEFFDHDEIMASEDFSNFLDADDLDSLVSLDDCLNNDISYILEEQILESFINGNLNQSFNQLDLLWDNLEFFDWLKGNPNELKFLRALIEERL